MHAKSTFALIVGIIWWNFPDPAYSTDKQNEALCIRTTKERNESKIFQGRKTMADRPRNIPDLGEDDEESRYFQMVSRGTVFVDKSLLIRKILRTEKKILIITAPRRSGKTTNLNMLKDFLEIRAHDEYTIKKQSDSMSIRPPSAMASYRFFTEGKLDTRKAKDRPLVPFRYRRMPPYHRYISDVECWKLVTDGEALQATYTDPPLIGKCAKNIVDEYLGRYPIIYMDFKVERDKWNWNNSEETVSGALKSRVCDVFAGCVILSTYMMIHREDSETTDEEKKATDDFEYYRRWCTGPRIREEFTDEKLRSSLLFLTKAMHVWTGKPVFLLIDNFDMFFENLYFGMNNYNVKTEEYQSRITNHTRLLKNFLNKTLIDNRHLEKAVITGTMSVFMKDFFKDIPNLKHYNVIDSDLREFYGFTEGETQLLFDHFEIPAEQAERARLHYKGYTVKPGTNVTLYDMESITKFVNTTMIENWWIQVVSGMKWSEGSWIRHRQGVTYWLNFKKLEPFLQPLIDGNDVAISFTEMEFGMDDVLRLIRPTTDEPFEVTERAVNVIFSMLLEMGFFTISERETCTKKASSDICIRIPSPQIKHGLKEILATSPTSQYVFRQAKELST